MNWRSALLKFLLASVCVVSLALGLIFFTSRALTLKVATLLYGVNLAALGPSAFYFVKMLGCSLIAIGVMSGLAIKDPAKNRIIVYGNIVWLLMRVLQRVFFAKRIHETISYARIWSEVAFVFVIAVAFFLLRPETKEK